MAGNGPPPKSPEQKKLEGTYRKDRDESRSALMAPAGKPLRPPGLSGEALQIWTQLAPKLVRLKTLAKVDGGVLEAYCINLAYARQLDQLAVATPVVETAQGPKINPAAAEARKRWEVVRMLATDLGLSYAARTKTPPPTLEDAQDPDEKFLFGEKRRPRAEA